MSALLLSPQETAQRLRPLSRSPGSRPIEVTRSRRRAARRTRSRSIRIGDVHVADTVRVVSISSCSMRRAARRSRSAFGVTSIAVLAGEREVDLAGTAAEPELLDLAPAVRRVFQYSES